MSAQQRANNEGVNMLARVLQKQMSQTAETPPILDFGVIQGDYSLLTNNYPIPIPQTDYLVCRQLTLGKKDDVLTSTQVSGKPNDGKHTHPPCTAPGASGHIQDGGHVHDVLIPEKMRWLKPDDHVLVVWVGTDAVVVDIIYPATEVG